MFVKELMLLMMKLTSHIHHLLNLSSLEITPLFFYLKIELNIIIYTTLDSFLSSRYFHSNVADGPLLAPITRVTESDSNSRVQVVVGNCISRATAETTFPLSKSL